MTGVISMSNKTEDGLILRVKDVFQAIQGDGPLSGEPCAVLQLEGCDLKCWFCDADFEGGAAYELPRLVDLLERTAPPAGPGKKRLCVITGGEPMMQAIGPLVITLLGNRWAVQIETAGNLYSKIPESPFLQVVCSPKTQTIHPKVRARVTAWKYLIRCGDEYSKGDGPAYLTDPRQEEGWRSRAHRRARRAYMQTNKACARLLAASRGARGKGHASQYRGGSQENPGIRLPTQLAAA